MKLMLDTDICIYLIKQHPPSVLERFLSHPVGDIGNLQHHRSGTQLWRE